MLDLKDPKETRDNREIVDLLDFQDLQVLLEHQAQTVSKGVLALQALRALQVE